MGLRAFRPLGLQSGEAMGGGMELVTSSRFQYRPSITCRPTTHFPSRNATWHRPPAPSRPDLIQLISTSAPDGVFRRTFPTPIAMPGFRVRLSITRNVPCSISEDGFTDLVP